jgi:hypothetical protein
VSRTLLSITFSAVALALAASAGARSTDFSITVVFHVNHQVTATLDDGRQLGSTSGAPTVIAPGHYNISMDDSAAVEGPSFDLNGPGVKLYTDMFYGEIPSESYAVDFQPNSTYTWKSDEQPNTVFTFVTSGTGGSSGSGAGGLSSGSGGTSTGGSGTSKSNDIVGSGVSQFRGALDVIVPKTGPLSLTRNGRKVTSLKAGRWTFSVDDESTKAGFTVQSLSGTPQAVTSPAYVGSHDVTVNLKPGRWFFFTPGGKKTTFFVAS